MLVLFNENNKECLRVYAEPTQYHIDNGVEVDEKTIPSKEGYNTVIVKNGDSIDFEYEKINTIKEDEKIEKIKEELSTAIAEIIENSQKTKEELSMAIAEVVEMLNENVEG